MRFDEVREILAHEPFEPFRIHLSNGPSYDIRHREFAGLTRASIHVGISFDADEIPDRMIRCDLLHVVSLETINGNVPKSD